MALVWVATAPISVSPNVRAFNRNDIVPDSVVAALALTNSGLVVQREVDVDTHLPSRGVDPVTQDELDALTTGTGRLSDAKLRAAFAALRPTAWGAAGARPNGTPTALDSGQPLTVFGNSPLTVSGGAFTHTPWAAANAAGYMQADIGSAVVTVGAEVVYPADSTGAIALVLPLAAWSNGSLSVAGVHFVMYGNGSWHVSNWTGSAEQFYAEGRCTSMLDGLPRRVEVAVDRASSILSVYLPDGTTASLYDSRVTANTGRFAVWECYASNGVGAVPARISSVWAHGAADVTAPRNPASATRGDIAKAAAKRTRKIVEHTTTATNQEVPRDCLGALVTIIAPGGGGGSGRRGAAGTVRCGGGAGGSGGVITDQWVPRSMLGLTYNAQIGTAGIGGAAATVNDTNGSPGTSATGTSFASGTTTLRAIGGAFGSGGTATSGTNGGAGAPLGTSGASASTTGGVGSTGALVTSGAAGSAGAGGGITSADVPGNGGAGSSAYLWGNNTGGAGGVVDGTLPGQGADAAPGRPGDAPGGGAASITTAAQAGASALGYGAGGGGGGASLNGLTSGKGGDGGSSYMRVTFVFS